MNSPAPIPLGSAESVEGSKKLRVGIDWGWIRTDAGDTDALEQSYFSLREGLYRV